MSLKVIQVLKSAQVSVKGSVRLGTGGGAAPVRTSSSTQANTGTGVHEARIVESNSEYAIIEITCDCGAKSHIQCNYAGAADGEQ